MSSLTKLLAAVMVGASAAACGDSVEYDPATNAATKAQDITAGGPVTPIRLNVDARPFLNSAGAIQLELTIDYNPLGPMSKDTAQLRPTEINQSMTIVLQSGKPMIVSQAADPVTDRKIIVEVVATIVK